MSHTPERHNERWPREDHLKTLLVATFVLPGMGILLQMTRTHVWVGSKALVGVTALLVLLRLLLVLGALNKNPQLLNIIVQIEWVSNRGLVQRTGMHGRGPT